MAALAAILPAQAAVHVIASGDSLQSTIDQASDGDTIRLAAGSYAENISLTKGLTIIPASTNAVTVAGNWNISNISTAPVRLGAFRITGTLSANNVQDIALADMHVSSSMSYSGCGWHHKNTTSGSITVNGCPTTLYASRVNGTLSHTAPSASCNVIKSTVTGDLDIHQASTGTVFQCTIGQNLDLANLQRFWVGYSKMRRTTVSNGREGVLVGCHIDGNDLHCNGLLYLTGHTTIAVRNCIIEDCHTYVHQRYAKSYYANGIYANGGGVKVEVSNTVIRDFYAENTYGSHDPYFHYSANGVCVINGARCTITGSIIYGGNDDGTGSGRSVYGNNTVSVQHSCIEDWEGGVHPVNCITKPLNDVKFVDMVNYELQAGSPCIDLGPPGSIYEDLDGSRNDMGCWGGHAFSPDGWTTPLPMVIATKATPNAVMHGETIQIEAHAAVAGN